MACTAKSDCAAYLGRSYPSRLPPLFGKSPIEPRQFVFSHVLQTNNITKQRALGADLGTRPAAHPPGPALPPPRCTDLGRSCPRRAAPAVLPAIGPATACEALRNTHHRLKMCNLLHVAIVEARTHGQPGTVSRKTGLSAAQLQISGQIHPR